jgi:hypothetical protein
MKKIKLNKDNLAEINPPDQMWVHYPEFEAKLYDPKAVMPEVTAITFGPKLHWFSYYDKLQFDPSCRYVLGMEVDFDFRTPRPDDVINIGMIDLENNNHWTELGQSCAWGWQQGCMLQWRPRSAHEVIWNDRIEDRFVSHILDVKTGDKKTLPYPIYHISPDGKQAVGADFARIQDMRPGYGYAGIADPHRDALRPAESGIYLMDLDTGEQEFVISIADVAGIPYADADAEGDKHYFNHLEWSPDGKRFLFIHRWRSLTNRWPSFRTRMFTAAADGSGLRLVTDKKYVSHFVWRDPQHIAIWQGEAYKLFPDDGSGSAEIVLQATNGHQSYHPQNSDWMISDTYADKDRLQHLYLYHEPTGKVKPVGRFFLPERYGGEWRCDLHARLSPDGKSIVIDSAHTDQGRQMYLIDISSLV